MWVMVKEWFNRNKGYLAMLFLSSLAIGAGVAALSATYPAVLSAFVGLTLYGVAPLAFLTSLSIPLAVFTLGVIMAGASFVLLSASLASMKQLITIGSHVYPLLVKEEDVDIKPLSEASYDIFKNHLKLQTPEHFDDVDAEEFHELSSDCSDEEQPRPIPLICPEVTGAIELEIATNSMSFR
ncbi:hypothetical protein [uncultured Legionella sp.]|uniref:hypothetical protein n=1 Tax=uncultured Legionella sp. TaxID=210934 RepID=UPI00262EA908|nr:hypothetical protein [uncultured Legionella sp.]